MKRVSALASLDFQFVYKEHKTILGDLTEQEKKGKSFVVIKDCRTASFATLKYFQDSIIIK